jgi:2-hydroxycyclohexanecarboxyl-CoA dehydrogenase|tara:strand:+ start:123 stop:884 length:762 start_codon:yes stop_codon:yes gene_type:complete
MDRLKGKVAVVTGGGGGIGSATCRRFAEEGAKVAVLDIDLESAQAVAASIPDSDTLALRVDITNLENVEQSIEQTEQQLGSVDILINNAGWDVFRPFLKTNPTFWRKVIDINLVGVLNMHHVVLPGMVKRGYGRVVSVSSDAGRVGSSGESVYAACKAGMIGFARTLAREHARQGITFNVVCPGPTDTALFSSYSEGAGDPEKLRNAMQRAVPMGRIGTPDDLPGAIAFLASDDAAYITGQVISVSGGLTMSG